MKVIYHQEFKDAVLELREHKIPAAQRADGVEWNGKALFLGPVPLVVAPVEGKEIGQYTPASSDALLELQEDPAKTSPASAELERLAAENAALKAEVEAAKAAAGKTQTATAAAQKPIK